MLEDRSSAFGRGREDGSAGDPGSFLTLIMGARLRGDVLARVGVEAPGGDVTHELGLLLPLELFLSSGARESGEPLLRGRFWAGSWADEVGAEAATAEGAEEGAMEVN